SERLIGDREAKASGLSREAYGEILNSSAVNIGITNDPFGGFGDYEEEFRRHFEEELTESNLDFDEISRAYRYGMILAEHGGFGDGNWFNVEPFARRGWESRNQIPWEEVRQAVRHGWSLISRGRSATKPWP